MAPNLTKEKNTEVQQRIFETAEMLFVENGYKSTSIRDIATQSGVNIAMINYYYHSKLNLFEIIFENIFDLFAKRLLPILQSDLDFFELLEQWIDSYFEILIEHPHIPSFILNEVNQNPDKLIKKIKDKGTSEIYAKLKNRIEAEIEKKTIKALPPESVLLNILSLCLFPFIFGKLVLAFNNVDKSEYVALLSKHKQIIIQSVTDILRKD